MAEDHLSTWISFQQRTWDSDTGKAKTIIVKRKTTDDIIFTCPVETADLAQMIKTALAMQAAELPKGAHGFLCVSLDDKGVQMSELPQTVRGASTDATNAAQEAIAMQNAVAKAMANLDFANHALQRQLAQSTDKLIAEVEDKFAVLDKLVVTQGSNFESQLMLEKFNRSQARLDLLIENLAPAVGILANWACEKVIASNPDLKKALSNVGSATTKKPIDQASSGVLESGKGPIQEHSDSGGKGNGRIIPA